MFPNNCDFSTKKLKLLLASANAFPVSLVAIFSISDYNILMLFAVWRGIGEIHKNVEKVIKCFS